MDRSRLVLMLYHVLLYDQALLYECIIRQDHVGDIDIRRFPCTSFPAFHKYHCP